MSTSARHETTSGVIEPQGQNLIFERLRLETQDLHQEMERNLPFFSAQFTLEDYKHLLERYAGFYSPVEAKLTALASLGLSVFDETRRKLPLLQLDLRHLGITGHELDRIACCSELPELATVGQGMGCLYVLEGSTLGGQIILRHLQQTLGLTAENGGAFFSCYGNELGRRWKEFRQVVADDERSTNSADEIVAAARDTFRCFHGWLTSTPSVPR